MNSALSFSKALKTVMIPRVVPAAQAWVKNASLKGDQVFSCFLSPSLLKKVILLLLVVRGFESFQWFVECSIFYKNSGPPFK